MLSVVSGVLAIGSILAIAYLAQLWTDRGLLADVTGTGGYTTLQEKVLLVVSALGIPTFITLTVTFIVQFFARRDPKQVWPSPQDQQHEGVLAHTATM